VLAGKTDKARPAANTAALASTAAASAQAAVPAAPVSPPPASSTMAAPTPAPPPPAPPVAATPAPAEAPATATETCGKRLLVAHYLCMKRECARTELAGMADCKAFAQEQDPFKNSGR
jgi:hypothetical protein